MERKTKGRQKIEMKKIDDIDALQVTFSKRRSGLFKKASELSTLCNAEIAVVVYSPARRVFTFGQPGVDAVVDRFLGSSSNSGPRVNSHSFPNPMEHRRQAFVHHLNSRCIEISDQLKAQKKKRVELMERLHMLSHGPRGELVKGHEGLKSLNLEDMKKIAKQLEDLKVKANARATEILRGATSSSSMPLAVNPIQMVNPNGNEAMNVAPAWSMGGVLHVPSNVFNGDNNMI